MIDIREHGGSFGGGKQKYINLADIKENSIKYPKIKTVSAKNASVKYCKEFVNDKYIFASNYYSSTSSILEIFDAKTLEKKGEITNISSSYNSIKSAIALNGKLFLSYDDGSSTGRNMYVYNESDFTFITGITLKAIHTLYSYDENYLYCLVSDSTGNHSYMFKYLAKINILTYEFTFPDLPYLKWNQTYNKFYRLIPTDYIYLSNTASNGRCLINLKFELVESDPTKINSKLSDCDGFINLISNKKPKLVYGYKNQYSSSNVSYTDTIYYFDTELNLIKSELITDGYQLSYPFSDAFLDYTGRFLTFFDSYNDRLTRLEIDKKTGYFLNGNQTFRNSSYILENLNNFFTVFYDEHGEIVLGRIVNEDSKVSMFCGYLTLR